MLTTHNGNRDLLFEAALQLGRENVVIPFKHLRRRRKRHAKAAYQDRQRVVQLRGNISAVIRGDRPFEQLNERTAVGRL